MPAFTPDRDVEGLAARSIAGESLSLEEATRLCSGDPLTLGGLADDFRRRIHGERAFLVTVQHVDWDGTTEPSDIPDELRLGPAPEGLTPADLRATIDRTARASPGIPIRALRPAELIPLAKAANLTPRILLGRIADAGLATLAFPQPHDDPQATRDGLLAAHGAGLPTYAPIPYRPRYSARSLAATILDLRSLPGAADRFRAAVPLPSSRPEESPLTGTTGLEDLRVFACARILFPAPIRIAVETDAIGPKLGAVALSFGADTLAGALAQPTARLTPKDAEKPRPFNADRARRLLQECGRTPAAPPPYPARDA